MFFLCNWAELNLKKANKDKLFGRVRVNSGNFNTP
jgi:hypothetical protein